MKGHVLIENTGMSKTRLICVSTGVKQQQQQQQQQADKKIILYLPVPPIIVEYSHRLVMEWKDPPVMVEPGPGHWILFVEPPVIVCAPTLESCYFLLLTTASKIILFQPPLTAEFSAKHTLLSPPLITLPSTTLPTLGDLDECWTLAY